MMPTDSFGKVVDKAIVEANEQFLSETEAVESAQEDGRRWAALTAAQSVAQGYGVVLPIATVEEILKALKGEPTRFDAFDAPLLDQMVENALESAKQQPEERP